MLNFLALWWRKLAPAPARRPAVRGRRDDGRGVLEALAGAVKPQRADNRGQRRPQPTLRREDPGRQAAQQTGYLAVHGVEKSFGARKVVRDVSLYVRRGEAVGLLGPNGAGKTTVFYMITGLIKADRGRVELDGYDVTALPMYQRARLGIGYLPQEASIFRGLSVEDNIRSVLEVVEPTGASAMRTSTRCWRSSISAACAKRRRSRCPAASGGAWKSRVRWRRGRATCCSTNRSRASIRSPSAISRRWSAT